VNRVAEITGVAADQLSIKAKTNERLGAIGSGDAVAALALVGLVRLG